jgi:flagellar hook-length control protein FliK
MYSNLIPEAQVTFAKQDAQWSGTDQTMDNLADNAGSNNDKFSDCLSRLARPHQPLANKHGEPQIDVTEVAAGGRVLPASGDQDEDCADITALPPLTQNTALSTYAAPDPQTQALPQTSAAPLGALQSLVPGINGEKSQKADSRVTKLSTGLSTQDIKNLQVENSISVPVISAPDQAIQVQPPVSTMSLQAENIPPFLHNNFSYENAKLLKSGISEEYQIESSDITDLTLASQTQGEVSDSTIGPGPFTTHITGIARNYPVTGELNVPLQHPGWDESFSEQILWYANNKVSSAILYLNPSELGPLQVRLKWSDDQANIQFLSVNSTVHKAIESALPLLRDIFSEGGVQLANVSVGHSDSETKQQMFQNRNDTIGMDPDNDAATASPAITGVSRHDGLIDYYI